MKDAGTHSSMMRLGLHKVDLAIIIILLIAGIKFTFGLENVADIGLYDESGYLYAGATLPAYGFPLAENAPLYALWYYILSLFEPDKIKLYYLNYKIATIVPPILLYVLMRRYNLSVILSIFVSVLLLISQANLPIWPKPAHIALIVILISLIAASFAKNAGISILVASVGALLSSYMRPENFLTYLLLLFLYLIVVVKRREIRAKDEWIALGAVLSLSFLLLSTLGMPAFSRNDSRSFGAFGQHFSLNWVSWTGSSRNPWTEAAEIMAINFGDATSVSSAFLYNPSLFLKHIATNIYTAIVHFFPLFLNHINIVFPVQSRFVSVEASLLFGLIVLAIYKNRSRWVPEMNNTLRKHKRLLTQMSLFMVPGLISALVIYPRDHYLLLPGVLIIVAIALLVAHPKEEEKWGYQQLAIIALVVISLTPTLANQPTTNRYNVETISFIESLGINEPVYMLEAEGGYYFYLADNYHRIAEYDKSVNFNSFMSENDINMIVLTDRLNSDVRFRNDAEWQSFLANYESLGFTQVDILNTNRKLILKRELLNDF